MNRTLDADNLNDVNSIEELQNEDADENENQ